jgi:hypothetical protein
MNLIAHVIDRHQVDIRRARRARLKAKPGIKQTKSTSAMGQKRTLRNLNVMSALPPRADMLSVESDVR